MIREKAVDVWSKEGERVRAVGIIIYHGRQKAKGDFEMGNNFPTAAIIAEYRCLI